MRDHLNEPASAAGVAAARLPVLFR